MAYYTREQNRRLSKNQKVTVEIAVDLPVRVLLIGVLPAELPALKLLKNMRRSAYYTREQNRRLSKILDLGNQSFDTFSFDWYSPEPWGNYCSPLENMESIRASSAFRLASRSA